MTWCLVCPIFWYVIAVIIN